MDKDSCRAKDPSVCRFHGNLKAGEPSSRIPLPTESSDFFNDTPGHEAYATIASTIDATPATNEDLLKSLRATPLKKATVKELTLMILAESRKADMNPHLVNEGLKLAGFLHRDDIRADLTVGAGAAYIGHPLRNAVRAIRLGNFSTEVLVGNLLHDTVEDHPKQLSSMYGKTVEDPSEARRLGLQYIEMRFGERTKNMVEGMSNPFTPRFMPAEQKNKIYADHVAEGIQSDDVLIGKLCDFKDNALSLRYSQGVMSPVGIGKRARKYLPVLDILKTRLEERGAEAGCSEVGSQRLLHSLSQGREWLVKLSTVDKT